MLRIDDLETLGPLTDGWLDRNGILLDFVNGAVAFGIEPAIGKELICLGFVSANAGCSLVRRHH